MLKIELLEIIAAGENSGIEFKRDDVRPEQIAREIVAMANLKGGRLLLGVDDDGTITGIQRPKTEEWVMNILATKIHPMLLPFYEEVVLDNGKRVAVVTISEGPSKPYVLRHEGREEIFIRVGSTTRRATREQQARLHEMGGILHTELLPVSGAGLNVLDRQRITDFLQHILQDAILPKSDTEWSQRLMALGFMTSGPGGIPVCTIAGLLLFGFAPRSFLRQAGIRIMIFEGSEKAYHALYDRVIDAPILPLWTTSNENGRVQAADGLLEIVNSIIQPFISEESSKINVAFRKEVSQRFSREVIREVLLNAVAHRDWTRFTDIELVIYADRLELTSPGPLPNTMTIEKMIAGQRSPRNPLLVDILRDYGYVDARGMGIRNKVIPLVRKMTGQDPIFEETDDYLKTIIPAAGVSK
ncbi:RNA-binding domain-containing protein [Syntrophus aciditrophicus]|uniref:Transcriptional regulator containing an HTH domain n=1 Tax=Syntrophus aciditrophicus (strain SB) TaxID=56780 RepID=Q2LRR7_SYNAS|nr:RNA-binding domain-containing protein [Syntrophus aciditrophicus]ABC76779.1 transcriptional regulator containing an HTH domain [Syntrophus aciditrophicus SB]